MVRASTGPAPHAAGGGPGPNLTSRGGVRTMRSPDMPRPAHTVVARRSRLRPMGRICPKRPAPPVDHPSWNIVEERSTGGQEASVRVARRRGRDHRGRAAWHGHPLAEPAPAASAPSRRPRSRRRGVAAPSARPLGRAHGLAFLRVGRR
jgi:hypothetical protein